jgi:hypothetical protein
MTSLMTSPPGNSHHGPPSIHDVALVHERQALALLGNRVFDGRANQPLRPVAGDRLQAYARTCGKANLLEELGERRSEELLELLDLRRALLELDAGVDVLGVFAEDDHVHEVRPFYRRLHAPEVPNGTQAHVQVELLSQRDVERSNSAANRSRQRALDANEVLPEGLERLVGKPVPGLLERLLAGEDLSPFDPPSTCVHFFYCGIKNAYARAPDVRTCPITLDERDDGTVWNVQAAVCPCDRFASRGHRFSVARSLSS